MVPVVQVRELGKRYQLGDRVHYGRLSESVMRAAGAPLRALDRSRSRPEGPLYRWALRDVSFDIAQGEVVGFVGTNGAGKSTLLKLLSRITEPTEGQAILRGRVGSLLEVGTGFHPELTGRENVFLSGAILGMRRAEIKTKYNAIVEFAEIGDYIDTPIKRYSSGMQVRLGFAVAAHLDSEILIVDEVLAVGDAAFQRRCLGKLEDVAHAGGRTILFVSHNMQAVHGLCDRAIYLERGRLIAIDDAPTIVHRYLEQNATKAPEQEWAPEERPGDETLRLAAVRVIAPTGEPSASTTADTAVIVELIVDVDSPDGRASVGFDLENDEGTVVLTSFSSDGRNPPTLVPGLNRLRAEIPGGLLNAGGYTVAPRAVRAGGGVVFHAVGSAHFEVLLNRVGGADSSRRPGVVAPTLGWDHHVGSE